MSEVITAVASFIQYCLTWVGSLLSGTLLNYAPILIVFSFIVVMPVLYKVFEFIRGESE